MPDIEKAIELLLKYRNIADIDLGNPYIFPARNGSLMPIRGSEVVRQYRETIPLQRPEAITATKMRKHAATATQVLNMTENDQDNFAKHMGHDILVHRKFYRRNEKATGVIDVGKILKVLESGTLKEQKGKTLQELQIITEPGTIHI